MMFLALFSIMFVATANAISPKSSKSERNTPPEDMNDNPKANDDSKYSNSKK